MRNRLITDKEKDRRAICGTLAFMGIPLDRVDGKPLDQIVKEGIVSKEDMRDLKRIRQFAKQQEGGLAS